MVNIKLRKTTIKDEKQKELTYSTLIKAVINNGTVEGLNIEEIRDRQRILDALKINKIKLRLEDADYKKLVECVEQMKWTIIHKDIIKFVDDIKEAKINKGD